VLLEQLLMRKRYAEVQAVLLHQCQMMFSHFPHWPHLSGRCRVVRDDVNCLPRFPAENARPDT